MSSSYSDGRFLLRSGGLDEPDGMIASSGIGMPLSVGNNGAGGWGGELYGRYDFVRRAVKSVSRKGGPSTHAEVFRE